MFSSKKLKRLKANRQSKTSIVAGVLAVGLLAAVVTKLLWPPINLYKQIPVQVFTTQPELKAAYDLYNSKGGKYIWGDNDCSVFVMDYLIACEKPVHFRPTTATLMESKFMAGLGYTADPVTPLPGDIIVYRYQNKDDQWRGHTGVVATFNNRLWVMHNTESQRGVVLQDIKQFNELATRLTKNNGSLYRIYRRGDFKTWNEQLQQRLQEKK